MCIVRRHTHRNASQAPQGPQRQQRRPSAGVRRCAPARTSATATAPLPRSPLRRGGEVIIFILCTKGGGEGGGEGERATSEQEGNASADMQ